MTSDRDATCGRKAADPDLGKDDEVAIVPPSTALFVDLGAIRASRNASLRIEAVALEGLRRRQARIRRIEAALARIDAGDFGYCADCGDAIDTARLERDPTTSTCLTCARRPFG